MGTARGYKSQAVIDFETTFGQDPTTPSGRIMPINSNTVNASRNKNTANTIRGHRNPAAPFDGYVNVAGDIVAPVDALAFAFWLKAMFGAPTTTDNTDGTFTHVFKVGDVQPSLVVEKKFSDAAAIIAYAKYNGCKIGSWNMEIGGDGELVSTFNLVGAKETIGETAYHGAAADPGFDRFQITSADIKEGGVSSGVITSLDFTVDFGLDTDDNKRAIGGGAYLADIIEGIMGISGNLSALFQNRDLLDKAQNSTETSLALSFTDGDNILAIEFAEVQIAPSTPGIDGPQGVLLDLSWQGYFDDGADASAVKVSLTNTNDGTEYA